jgi:membrane fusion protein (multidrug efflux system)
MNVPKYNNLILLLLVFTLFSCSSQNETAEQPLRIHEVEATVINPRKFTYTIFTTGSILAWESVEIRSPVQGIVLRILFDEGEVVSEGKLLVNIDDRAWQARLEGLHAREKSLENELNRKQELIGIEGVSKEEMEQTEAELLSIQAQMKELSVNIDLARIRAPFNGQLGMRNISPGAYLSQGDLITVLVQSDPVRVDFNFPVRYAYGISEGNTINLISSSSGDSAKAVIYAINPIISEANRSLNIRAKLDNPDMKFLPGDFARILFNIRQLDDVLLIPAESIIPGINSEVVYTSNNGIVERNEIETGTRTPSEVEVIRGLQPGDTVIVTGLMEINPGDSIIVKTIKEEGAL